MSPWLKPVTSKPPGGFLLWSTMSNSNVSFSVRFIAVWTRVCYLQWAWVSSSLKWIIPSLSWCVINEDKWDNPSMILGMCSGQFKKCSLYFQPSHRLLKGRHPKCGHEGRAHRLSHCSDSWGWRMGLISDCTHGSGSQNMFLVLMSA